MRELPDIPELSVEDIREGAYTESECEYIYLGNSLHSAIYESIKGEEPNYGFSGEKDQYCHQLTETHIHNKTVERTELERTYFGKILVTEGLHTPNTNFREEREGGEVDEGAVAGVEKVEGQGEEVEGDSLERSLGSVYMRVAEYNRIITKQQNHLTMDADSDYREYYRDRPRGEFLTRGAAMSSQNTTQPARLAQQDYGRYNTQTRLGRNLSSEKLGQQERTRNPTILRKKLDVCVYLMSAVAVQMEIEEGANSTVTDILNSLVGEEEMALPRNGSEMLSLWMVSPLLEVQLKPHHKPYFIRREWNHFLQRFSSAVQDKKACDEPILSLQRNVFVTRREESLVKDPKLLELLYEEAKYNILTGRYPCEISDYIMLGGIQARLELGPYDVSIHTHAFIRQNLQRFLPQHACRQGRGLMNWLPWPSTSKSSTEARLIDQFKAIPNNASPKRLIKKYLEFCWSLPYYGSAFFRGQIETPAKSLSSLVVNEDTEVLIAINSSGIYVLDPVTVVVLLGLKFEELSWDYAKPSQENNEDCLPCLFLQFCAIENGRRVSKILQVFSRQAVQMDALISGFVEDIKQRAALYSEDNDANMFNDNAAETDDCLIPLTTVSRRGIPESCLSNKLNRLTLATFDDEGHCIGHMGSWSFSN